MSHTPKGWTLARLGDIAEIKGGLAKGKDREGAVLRSVPYLRVANVQQRYLDLSEVSEIGATESEIRDLALERGDVLLNEGGDRDKLGRGWVWEGQIPLCIHQNHVFRARAKADLVDPYYLSYWANTEQARNYFIKTGNQTTNLASISKSNLSNLPVPLPPLPEQRRIAAILDQAEALRAKRRAALAKLDTLAQSIFVEMFGDPEENSKQIPTSKLHELCTRVTDGTHQSPRWEPSGIPFLFISNIVDGRISYDTNKYISRETYFELTRRCPIEKGDVLFTTVGSYGNAAVVDGSREFCFQRHIAHIKPNPAKLDSTFLAVMIESPGVRRQVDKVAKGIAQKTVNLTDLKSLRVFAPAIELQREFTQKMAHVQDLKMAHLRGLALHERICLSLQHRAFRGEL